MSQESATALLCAARDLIARIRSWRVTATDRSAAAELLDSIDRVLNDQNMTVGTEDMVEIVRAQWRDLPEVEIDSDAVTRHDQRASWVRAWLLAQPARAPIDPERFREALGSLPIMAREVYRLHRIDGQSLAETGRQLGLDPATTEVQLFEAQGTARTASFEAIG
ncbi:sigma factor-like helix-turn-helix DNA-binding protein [Sphingomonas bisphenolicum]|nr:sigma-70 region 4 domain-containing protein [Sphingomonas bisphenolicum]